jgi:hypothetical protein
LKVVRVAALALVVATAACESRAEREAREVAVAKVEIARSDSTARVSLTRPPTGKWDEENLTYRLLRAGVAPRKVLDAPPGPDFMRGERLLFVAGGGEVHAWIYPDSLARIAVSSTLDSARATPPGVNVPFESPVTLVLQNNLIAVIAGGSWQNHERISLALQAGLPAALGTPP